MAGHGRHMGFSYLDLIFIPSISFDKVPDILARGCRYHVPLIVNYFRLACLAKVILLGICEFELKALHQKR